MSKVLTGEVAMNARVDEARGRRAVHGKQLQSTAYHEAGHAIAAWARGLRFRYVTIVPHDGRLGHIRHAYPKWFRPDMEFDARHRNLGERHIIMSFAGQIAEAKFLGKRPRYGQRGDNEQAADLALALCHGSPATVDAFLKYCWCSSADIVDIRWEYIQALAVALMQKRTMKYRDVLALIAELLVFDQSQILEKLLPSEPG